VSVRQRQAGAVTHVHTLPLQLATKPIVPRAIRCWAVTQLISFRLIDGIVQKISIRHRSTKHDYFGKVNIGTKKYQAPELCIWGLC